MASTKNQKVEVDGPNKVNITFGPEDQSFPAEDKKVYTKTLKKLEDDMKDLISLKKSKRKSTTSRKSKKSKRGRNLKAGEFVRFSESNVKKFFDEDFMNIGSNTDRNHIIFLTQ
jgi:hypothetical protein